MGKNKYGNVTQNELEEKLNSNAGDGKTEVIDDGENFVVKFIESNRYYKVDNGGNVEYFEVIVDEHPGNIKVGIKGEELTGTEERPFEIWCIEDLVEWSQNYTEYINSYIKLGKTLNFNSNLSYTDGKILNCTLIEELREVLTDTSGSGFTPIYEFAGSFDGQNFAIQNIYVNKTENAGLFNCAGGKIENLEISGNIISNDGYAGGIGGRCRNNSSIINCINSCEVIANNSKSNVNGSLLGSAGGILGVCDDNVTINNCINRGNINSVAGSLYIYNCYNVGDISGSTAGGIMGYRYYNTTTEIKNCYNFSNISGDTNIGEIIGFNWAFDSIFSPTIENVFYRNNNIEAFGGFQNSNGTPTYYADDFDQNFVIKLNDYIKTIQDQEIEWNNWILGNKGYPIFE